MSRPRGISSYRRHKQSGQAHVKNYYRHPDSSPTSEVDAIRLALRRLKKLYGHTSAASFDTLALEARKSSAQERIGADATP